MSLVVDAHREFLSDAVRLSAYEAALRQVVRPGDVVVDLGAGTGILGLLACRAGAARVYAVEPSGLVELARAIAAENGVADRFRWIRKPAAEVTLPERADVLVGDFAGHMGFEAGVFELYAFAPRWLKSDARVVPSSITMFASVVEDPIAHANATFWRAPVAGLSMTSALRFSLDTGYPTRFDAAQVIAPAVRSAAFDTVSAAPLLRIDGRTTAARPATVHGVGAWFSAALAPGVEMTNAPGAAARLVRRNVFLPIAQPVPVQPGDTIELSLRVRPADMLVTWTVRIGGAVERRSTLGGMLIARDVLRAGDPAWHPALTPRGEGRRTVLELCDGTRTLGAIERAVFDRHRDLFASPAEAEVFVAEVVTRYARLD